MVQGDDVAHHVVDPDDRLGLEDDGAVSLTAALPVIAARESDMWVLALPVPGGAGALRGPADLTADALAVGEVVVAGLAGLALVPHRIGPAVQWRVWPAEPPAPPPSPPEADGALSETVIAAAEALGRLEVAAGTRPSGPVRLATAAGTEYAAAGPDRPGPPAARGLHRRPGVGRGVDLGLGGRGPAPGAAPGARRGRRRALRDSDLGRSPVSRTLFAIGGAEAKVRRRTVLRAFVAAAGGPDAGSPSYPPPPRSGPRWSRSTAPCSSRSGRRGGRAASDKPGRGRRPGSGGAAGRAWTRCS